MNDHLNSSSSDKYPSALKWRLQYGRRPPKKSEAQRSAEQEMIEKFLKNRPTQEVSSPVEEKKKSSSNRRDAKLVSKFLEKRVTSRT